MKFFGRIVGPMLIVAVSLAACSSFPDTDGAPSGADGITPLMTDGVAPKLTDATAPDIDCGGAADTVKAHVQNGKIQSVTVVGQCTLVVIQTSLGAEDEAPATQICESAAEVAYINGINGIAVKSSTGAELSQGINGAKCLP